MTKTFDQSKDSVATLCQYFAKNRLQFLAPGVKEAHIRQSLIDPLFETLGWDVRNSTMIAPQYREVVPEDSLEIEGQQKAPDYTFRVGPIPKFYAEAKKCGVNIHEDMGPAFQLRRYGWSGKVSVSILTDFEELAVYDCTRRPHPTDKAGNGRILYFGCEEYADRWREIWDVFSREAVWSGAFDHYAASKRKRGTSEVDDEFLREIEGWREALARNMALRNKDLTSDDLNAVVQRTIDRIVFLRMAEDRGLEPYGQLKKLCEQPEIYHRFIREYCRRADDKYNSGLFHFQKETGVAEAPDRLTPKLTVDDKVLRPILQSLYFAHGSPYHFGVLPVEILGTVYERFLGKVIRLTAGHHAKIEEKPEVRKAGGVYYTPAFIVDYIVRETVGRQIAGKSPTQLQGGKDRPPFRVLDMACGSGSFLLGAYQCLLDHCLAWYVDHKPDANKKAVYKHPRTGEWRLTVEERKRILVTHLFGVDIDAQAVEVSKLSLLLKSLEGETDATLALQLELFQQRVLPNLVENIKCGNSLIGTDYFLGRSGCDPDEIGKINPFDWNSAFRDAMQAGGFDCIIGNPPYIQLSMKEFRNETANRYLKERFGFSGGRLNTFAFFTDRARQFVRDGGQVGYILPNTVLSQEYYEDLRVKLLEHTQINSVSVPQSIVFKDAVVETVILIFGAARKPGHQDSKHKVQFLRLFDGGRTEPGFSVPQSELAANYKAAFVAPLNAEAQSFRRTLESNRANFGDYLNINQAIALKHDRAACLTDRRISAGHREVLDGRHIDRYYTGTSPNYFKFDVAKIHSCKREDIFLLPEKVVFRRVGDRLIGSLDTQQKFALNTIVVISLKSECPFNLRFVLALFNSSLLNYYYVSYLKSSKKVFSEIQARQVEQLPFPAVNLSAPTVRAKHDRLVKLVDTMIMWRHRSAIAKGAGTQQTIVRQINAVDSEIDRLVYNLYGLSDMEIALVEADTQRVPGLAVET